MKNINIKLQEKSSEFLYSQLRNIENMKDGQIASRMTPLIIYLEKRIWRNWRMYRLTTSLKYSWVLFSPYLCRQMWRRAAAAVRRKITAREEAAKKEVPASASRDRYSHKLAGIIVLDAAESLSWKTRE